MSYIIYLHGFNSSPQSEKARLTQAYFNDHVPHLDVYVPALPHEPLAAMETVKAYINKLGEDDLLGFIGSSLGGYYGLYLQHYFQSRPGMSALKLVLINPAVRPYELLSDYLGENKNLYTGESYQVEARHMQELKSLEVAVSCSSSLQYLLAQTDDEVLPFHDAVTKLSGSKMWISYGGSHAFDAYDHVLPSIAGFFQNTQPQLN